MGSSHHSEGHSQSELIKRFEKQLSGMQERTWGQGRISGDDDGELAFVVSSGQQPNIVRIDFGKPVEWLGLPPQEAVQLAQLLIKHARSVSTEPIRVSLT
jgi:hypothetical protein